LKKNKENICFEIFLKTQMFYFLKVFFIFPTLKRKEKNKKIFNGLKENIQK
jgi:hypothetical protein